MHIEIAVANLSKALAVVSRGGGTSLGPAAGCELGGPSAADGRGWPTMSIDYVHRTIGLEMYHNMIVASRVS